MNQNSVHLLLTVIQMTLKKNKNSFNIFPKHNSISTSDSSHNQVPFL